MAMITGHVLTMNCISVRKNPEKSKILFGFAAFLSHIPLDILPHADPGLFGYKSFMKPMTWVFWWVLADATLALCLTYRTATRFPRQWKILLIGMFACMLPDVIQLWATSDWLPGNTQWKQMVYDAHDFIHSIFRGPEPSNIWVVLGIIMYAMETAIPLRLLPRKEEVRKESALFVEV